MQSGDLGDAEGNFHLHSLWQENGYQLIATDDGSPTLRWTQSETQESMHHMGGAYTETQLIYGEPLRDSLKKGGRHFLSVGLGLGYNEILLAIEALKHQLSPDQILLKSFESEKFLNSQFLAWCHHHAKPEQTFIYDQILSFFNSPFQALEIRYWLAQAHQMGHWILEGALSENTSLAAEYECIMYDAFSSKTSPLLWQESFLTQFLQAVASPNCQFSTFACTGNLKRALKATGFEVVLRPGFQSKRNSTLGLRAFSSHR